MARYRLTPRAKADLISIARYTQEQWGKKQRNRYLWFLEVRFQWLAENPYSGRLRPEIAPDYYCYPEGHHIVFFLISENGIDIIGIPHKQMDIVDYFSSD